MDTMLQDLIDMFSDGQITAYELVDKLQEIVDKIRTKQIKLL